ncbi:MAG: double zinc ribbon domain-containing protein [Halioglobus sp.]
MVNSFPMTILDALFPLRCHLCGLACKTSVPLCSDCELALSPNNSPCVRCGLPLPRLYTTVTAPDPICGACQRCRPVFDAVKAPWLYEQHIGYLIGQWKYQRNQRLTALMTHLFLTDFAAATPDLIVPVPLNWRRQLWRGFNQAERLAQGLVDRHPRLKHALARGTVICKRGSAEISQSHLGARQRAALARDTFTVAGRCDNLRIAIIDDVLTTGATANALATALRKAGADHIEVWCIARTPAPGN